MSMNRHDAYYEPEDYDDRTDEIEERAWQLMKKGAKWDYRTTQAISEMFGELDVDQAKSLQDVIDIGDYQMLGQKIMSMACDYMEKFALDSAERELT
jgi:hypothetical protein